MTITKEGTLASFYTINKAPIKHLRVYFSPKQAGSGTASPENVREISGWNQLQSIRTNKSIYSFLKTTYTSTVDYYNGYSGWAQAQKIPDRTLYYTYSVYIDNTNCTQAGGVQIWFRNIDNTGYTTVVAGNFIPAGQKGWSKVTVGPSNFGANSYYVCWGLSIHLNTVASSPMVEIGNQMTEYEQYKGITQTIDWSNDIGTIYGGYVDLITGELVQTFTIEEPNDNKFNFTQNYCYQWGHSKCNTDDYASAAYTKAISSHWKTTQYSNADFVKLNSNGAFWIGKNLFTAASIEFTDEALQAYIAQQKANGTPLQAGGPLITPITYQLSPTELQTFLGRNNIWSNADRIEVEYDLAESNDELYRRRNILLQGAPHLETATGNIANFKTDLIAPIKEAKVYFEPIQEGSGTPSLENVREINGWNSVNIQNSGKNMLNPAYYTKGSSYTLNGTTYTYDGNGTVTLNGKSNGESSQVTFSWTQPFDCDYYFCGNCSFDTSVGDVYMWDVTTSARPTKWDGTTKSGASYPSSNLQQVKLLAGHHIQLCVRVYSVSTTELTNATAQPMLLPKTCTNTTFEPYNGTTIPITFPRTGKNLLDTTQVWNEALTENRWTIEQGKITCKSIGDGNSTRIWFTQTFQPGTYTISAKYTGTGISGTRLICNTEFSGGTWNNSYKGWWQNINKKLTFTLTEPSNIGLVYLSVSGHYNEEGAIYNIQLDAGEQQNAFQPYTETLYGGYIDIINGEIVVTSQYLIIDGTNDAASIANYGNNFYNGTLGTNRGLMLQSYYRTPILNGTTGIYCNKLKPSTTAQGIWGTPNDHIWEYQVYNHYQLHVVFDNATVGITEDMDWTPRTQAIAAWLKENPLTFILPLETPLHYPLTPQTLKTLKGTNNIWSSANGPVSIKYWTH